MVSSNTSSRPTLRLWMLLAVCCSVFSLHAQKEGYNWYFGAQAALNFDTSPPTVLFNSAATALEGTASISNGNGDLLFYTDGITVWNANHVPMPNGTGLLGDPSASQSGLIVPRPGNPDFYYVFSIDEQSGPDGLRYSEVDMALAGGLGDVIAATKNTLLLNNQTEKITAVRHANQTDIWVLTHTDGTADYYVYLVSAAGISPPQIQTVGTPHAGGILGVSSVGYLKTSSDGTRIAAAVTGVGFVEVLDFDPSTGVISNPIALNGPNQAFPYGVEFSPSGQYLYLSCESFTIGRLYQFDVSLPTAAQIEASRQWMNPGATGPNPYALQLAPDGAIYISEWPNSIMPAIYDPDLAFPACNYVDSAIDLSPNFAQLGLPNFITSFFGSVDATSNSPICAGDTLKLFANAPDSSTFLWTGPNAFTSTQENPFIPNATPADTGAYYLEAIYSVNGVPDTLYDTVITVMLPPAPTVALIADTGICAGSTLPQIYSLDPLVAGAYEFEWQDASTLDTFVNAPPGLYWLEIRNACGVDRDSMTIAELQIPATFSLGVDTLICPDDTLPLTLPADSGVTFLWQDNSTDQQFEVSTPGIYWGELQNFCGATRDSIAVALRELPQAVDFGADTTLCIGQTLVLSLPTAPDQTYLWQDSSTTPQLFLNAAGLYWGETQNVCGTNRDSIEVSIDLPPAPVSLGEDTLLCLGDTIRLMLPSDTGLAYVWQDNSTASELEVIDGGMYWGEITNACGSRRDTINIAASMAPAPFSLGADTFLCPGGSLLLSLPTDSGLTYQWNNGSTQSRVLARSARLYWADVINVCGTVRDSILLVAKDPPTVDLAEDTILCEGEILLLTAPRNADWTYLWQDGSTEPEFLVEREGLYAVRVENACGSDEDMTEVDLKPVPMPLDFEVGLVICEDDSLWLGPAPIPEIEYLWQDSVATAQRWVSEPGAYILTAQNRCGRAQSATLIEGQIIPQVLLPADTQICVGELLVLDATRPEIDEYRWQDGRITSTYRVDESGLYTVVGSNDCGTASGSVSVVIDPCDCQVFMPNAFSPNDDGDNERFSPITACQTQTLELAIYNRWGLRVFTGGPGEAWDGTIDGRPVPMGVYAWTLRYSWQAGTTRTPMRETRGTVTLVR